MEKGAEIVRSHLPTASSPRGEGQRGRGEPSRAEPVLAGAGRAVHTAPHRTGPLYSQLHLPAMTRTLKEEENWARSRSTRGAPSSVSEVISNSSADVRSALVATAGAFARLRLR